jgi:hypothetical protein
MNPEDRAAFTDARIAAVKAGLTLTPDQEKLWPPIESAVRDFAKMRMDRANARMNAQAGDSKDAQNGAPKTDAAKTDAAKADARKEDDPVSRLHQRADNMAATAAALKRIADAADPLYKTLDDGQKRRLAILTHMEGGRGGEGWRHRAFERGMGHGGGWDRGGDHWDRDRWGDRDHDGGPDRDHGGRGGPERL